MKNFFDDRMKTMSLIALGMLSFYLLMQGMGVFADIALRKKTITPTNTITFRGFAEVSAVPDVANFIITIHEEEKDVAIAQQKMTQKANKALDLFKEKGIDKKDIQTLNYSTNPKFTYQAAPCVNGVCPPGKQILTGYEASETISVKLRDITKSGEILSAISALEIHEISGPNLVVDDMTKLKSEAQALAIAKAKKEAEATADNLGVSLGNIVNFSEGLEHHFGPRPMMMAKMASFDAATPEVAPQIEAGQQKIGANVSITYEITQ
jgi:uncharacterized protein YggE